ncbi:MAG: hypothetical protein CW691_11565 [Candidatus Bathyarchaeum sp.]|nr:MAG: hypothetical protein CW691_11565 [Candidatus Bathyarchaeum sp.]
MSKLEHISSFKGRYSGVFVLSSVQFLNGAVHAVIGLCLIYAMSGELVYNVYTLLYGVFNIIFAYGLWTGKKSGWLGTIIVSLFVIVVDISEVLDVSLIPGVPRTAALGEIVYSLIVVVYLVQHKILQVFNK